MTSTGANPTQVVSHLINGVFCVFEEHAFHRCSHLVPLLFFLVSSFLHFPFRCLQRRGVSERTDKTQSEANDKRSGKENAEKCLGNCWLRLTSALSQPTRTSATLTTGLMSSSIWWTPLRRRLPRPRERRTRPCPTEPREEWLSYVGGRV